MSYIILNGVNSTSIPGLMICKLPPITKPRRRIEINEINGRDGDVLLDLGYSAYDKGLEVGLTKGYNINTIISYFDSSGVVTFSNEPDKYYRYRIIEQIDFEELLRFKVAKVILHIQPYKYDKNELTKTIDITDETENIVLVNQGNTKAKPIVTFYGSGTINIELNGALLLVLTLDETIEGAEEDYITIDCEQMEAYKGASLRNRQVIGNYNKFELLVGSNIITWSGELTKITVSQVSRWI